MELIREVRLVRWLRLLKRLIVTAAVAGLIVATVVTVLLLYLRSQPLPATEIYETTTIYDANEQPITTLYKGENRIYLSLDKIPAEILEATVAIEDQRFFSHPGFDWRRIIKALYVDLKEGEMVEGASTISQQLARNLYLTLDKTWERKAKEALLTIQLEINYSKEKILEKYLNEIYYGHSAYGIQAASKTYFGKAAAELNLAEAAMLAGVPKGPLYYSPWIDFKQAKQRQYVVLQAMVNQGFISEQEAKIAWQEPLHLRTETEDREEIAPYFRDYVVYIAKNKYGLSEEMVTHGGLKIYTTLDHKMQQTAEKSIARNLPADHDLQVALVAMDPSNGHIKAMVGGRNYQESQYNRVFAKRQPGSSFKPFLYLTAIENGFTPLTEMKSEPTVFTYGQEQKTYVPRNFGDQYPNDFINLQEAISKSDNIYAVKTHMSLGEQQLLDTAKRLGINSYMQPVPSLALGSFPVSPHEMAVAYSTLANLGKKVLPVAITRIEDRNGKILVEEKEEVKTTRVAEPSAVFVLDQLLRGVFQPGGTGHRISHILQRPAYGKTGTTDYDSWMAGFTPQLTTVVWTGYDENKRMTSAKDIRVAAIIWAEFLEKALETQEPAFIPIPENAVPIYIDPISGKLAGENCPNPQLMYFVAGTEPVDACDLHHAKEEQPGNDPAKNGPSLWEKITKWWLN